MKIAIAQIRVCAGQIAENFRRMKKAVTQALSHHVDLIVFPEMALSGYFNGDRWEQHSFLKDCEFYHQKIAELSAHIDIVFGSVGIDWQRKNEDGRVRKYNAVFYATKGRFLENRKTAYSFWPKTLLPNYSEFSDSRHFYDLRKLAFERGCTVHELYEPARVAFFGKTMSIGLSLCEDGWSEHYSFSPVRLFCQHFSHDFFLNLSCSPFTLGKREKREAVFSALSLENNIPFFYVNCVGVQNIGKNIFGFDGSSFVFDQGGNPVYRGPFFSRSLAVFAVDGAQNIKLVSETEPSLPKKNHLFSCSRIEETQIALEFMLKSCLEEWKIKRIVVAVSGGIDSALCAVLCARALGANNVFLLNMPSKFNSELTKDAAKLLATNLACPYASLSIEAGMQMTWRQITGIDVEKFGNSQSFQPTVLENIQARDRGGRLLAAIAASLGAVFSCNANKSEMTVGYSTLYGDLAGFLCPIGDLWKHDVYALAIHYNNVVFKKEVIPKQTLEVVPSAELSADQDVTQNQGDPFHYAYHDRLFCSWVEHWDRKSPEECLAAYENGTIDRLLGCEKGLVSKLFPTAADFIKDLERWWTLYQGMAAFKRVQSPPILTLSQRAFGFDHRESVGSGSFSATYLGMKKRLLPVKKERGGFLTRRKTSRSQ